MARSLKDLEKAFKNIGKVAVRDAELQATEFANQSLEIAREELGAAFAKAPELELAARKAFLSAARYHFKQLQGQQIPGDAMDQVKAQLAGVKVSGEIIAADAFANTVQRIMKAGLSALGNALGGIGGAVAAGLAGIVG